VEEGEIASETAAGLDRAHTSHALGEVFLAKIFCPSSAWAISDFQHECHLGTFMLTGLRLTPELRD